LITLWVHNTPIDCEGCKWLNIWKIINLNCTERYEFIIDHCSYTHNLSSCEIKAWKKFPSFAYY